MSKDDVASVYALMLDNEDYRQLVVDEPERLDAWDLTEEERAVLMEEASVEVSGYSFSFGAGPAMNFLSSGPPMSPGAASGLGIAMNKAAGLPVGSLKGPGFASGAGCCPWGHAIVGMGGMVE